MSNSMHTFKKSPIKRLSKFKRRSSTPIRGVRILPDVIGDKNYIKFKQGMGSSERPFRVRGLDCYPETFISGNIVMSKNNSYLLVNKEMISDYDVYTCTMWMQNVRLISREEKSKLKLLPAFNQAARKFFAEKVFKIGRRMRPNYMTKCSMRAPSYIAFNGDLYDGV